MESKEAFLSKLMETRSTILEKAKENISAATGKQEVFIEHIPRANVYGIECYNYSSSADSATPRD